MSHPAPTEPEPSQLHWIAGLPVPQWRFWYREMKQPGNGDGIDAFVFRLEGALDVAALGAAIQQVVGWHEALRTVIARVGERGTAARVLDPAALPTVLRVHRVPDLASSAPSIDEFAAAPFAIDTDLPIRALLLTTSHDEHRLVICTHHTAFDGWSATILTDQIGAAYRELRAGRTPRDRQPSSYRQIWDVQVSAETVADRAALLDWTRELLGVPDLPLLDTTDGAAPAASAAIREQWIALDESLVGRIARAAHRRGTTPNALLLAAWVRALRAVTGASDFAIGVPTTGRTTKAAIEAIGCFVSAVALRFRGTADTSAIADVNAVARELRQAMRFQFMPLEQMAKESTTRGFGPRDPHRIPFCQAGFVSQQARTTTLELDGVRSTYLHRTHPDSAFELTLEIWACDPPSARIWRRMDILDDERAVRLAACWLTELTDIVALLLEDADAQL